MKLITDFDGPIEMPLHGDCRYLYCDDVSLEADTVLPTLCTARKYMLPHLARACEEYLETNVDASNACLLLSQGRIFEEPELMQRCLDVIDFHAEEAIESDSFTDIDQKTLEQILDRDTFNVKETLIFEAVTRWAEGECTRQGRDVNPEQCKEVLGNALYLVRFPVMSLEEFADGAAQSGILSKQEIIDVFLFFGGKIKPKLQFSTIHRRGREVTTLQRFQSINSNWGVPVGRTNNIEFSVDKAISVVGFGLYSSGSAAEYKVGIGLKHNDGTVLCEESHIMSDDRSSKTTQVLFDRPVRIKANTYYTASFVESCSYGPGYFGLSGKAHVRCGNIAFTFRNSSDRINPTNELQGQIPEILFLCWPGHRPLTRCVKLRFKWALGIPGTVSRHRLQRKR